MIKVVFKKKDINLLDEMFTISEKVGGLEVNVQVLTYVAAIFCPTPSQLKQDIKNVFKKL